MLPPGVEKLQPTTSQGMIDPTIGARKELGLHGKE